ncbi:tryptophan-rich sensory protein [Methanomicrobium sp. W14]|uniref:TspO/MBR family protein n=1 Tax=Methanomicrobium sp. W14 TaxID=2817839 RepID=UPI001AEA52AD|nr:TspO/MBR family protein [Methanomicrobium sp. W14]MBP2133771.1 tryptophan-rich sensory protein [Methanomicrobium sp. W14]
MKRINVIKNPCLLAVSIVICIIPGIFGSLFTSTSDGSWYSSLAKPWFLPPSFLFPVVWTALYIMMGISLYLILKEDISKRNVNIAAVFFAVQLILNACWSFLFFGLESPLYGLIGIIFLWIFILLTIVASYKVSRYAGVLLVPYILWVTFAAVLNAAVLVLNPVVL